MNTKTMRLPPRRVLTPNAINNKRKDREEFDALKPQTPPTKLPKPDAPQAEPISPSSNQLLAGYLAHEFLSKGTLFGQLWDPVENEVVPVSPKKRAKPSRNGEAEPSGGQLEDYQRYVEVASLLKTDGAHLPGIVNPTQLACFLQM
ncbi:uncharacterized protein LOC132166260 [Corylus avellana]|uniref:uncharacterized protein LOC132166260 n=1 Tax=Corylus avellana TaxID=13451 RepID=UPI001E226405|nr:uncharacterized protein LOC132166260 [Corylus avellana]